MRPSINAIKAEGLEHDLNIWNPFSKDLSPTVTKIYYISLSETTSLLLRTR